MCVQLCLGLPKCMVVNRSMVEEENVFDIANEVSRLQHSLKEKQVEQLSLLIRENAGKDGLIHRKVVIACIQQVFSDNNMIVEIIRTP